VRRLARKHQQAKNETERKMADQNGAKSDCPKKLQDEQTTPSSDHVSKKQQEDNVRVNNHLETQNEGASSSQSKKKKKKKKKGGSSSVVDDNKDVVDGDSIAGASALPVGAQTAKGYSELQKALQMMMKAEDEKQAAKNKYLFWDTQPVPKLGELTQQIF